MRNVNDKALRQRNAMMRLTMAINHSVTPLILAVPLVLAAAASPASAQNPPCYEVEEIIFGPDCPNGDPATAIPATLNNNGELAGYYNCLGPARPFIWQGGTLFPLPLPPGVLQGKCGDLEDDGRIAGTMGGWSTLFRGYVYDNGQMLALDPLPGDNWSGATAMSVAGRVVGESINNATGPKRAVLWENGQITALELPHGPASSAADITDDGSVIVGWMGQAVGVNCRTFIWEDGEVTDIGTMFGGPSARPWAVNNSHVVVGYADVEVAPGEFNPCAFVWNDGQATNLGVLPGFDYSYALDINNANVVVGRCHEAWGDDLATLWVGGAMYDLNELIPSWPDLELRSAVSVNDAGQIAVKGAAAGDLVAILLTPIVADLNGDCVVNVEDLLILLGQWACSNSPADFNNDGTVNVLDLLFLLAEWTV